MDGGKDAGGDAWEHKVLELGLKDALQAKQELDRWGADGWELVSVVYVQPLSGVTGLAFLKRAKHRDG